jgi:hypothetical protein
LIAMTSAAPATQRRPSIVTLAGALLIVGAAVLIIRSLLPLPYLSDAADAAKAAYANSTDPNMTPDRIASLAKISTIAGAAVYVVAGVGIVILAMLDLRGNNVARIITWVVGGLGVLCCGLGSLAGLAGGSLAIGNSKATGVDTKEAAKRIMDAYPNWYQPVVVVLTVLLVLALAVALILLLLPAANEYFRKDARPGGPVLVEPPYPTLPS